MSRRKVDCNAGRSDDIDRCVSKETIILVRDRKSENDENKMPRCQTKLPVQQRAGDSAYEEQDDNSQPGSLPRDGWSVDIKLSIRPGILAPCV